MVNKIDIQRHLLEFELLKHQLMELLGDVNITTRGTGTFGYLVVDSTDGSDQIDLYHDNSNAFMTWTDGVLELSTDENNTSTTIRIKGKGTGRGQLYVYNATNTEYLNFDTSAGGFGIVRVLGSSLGGLDLQPGADTDIWMFRSAANNETRELKIGGRRDGDVLRHLEIGVGVDAADTASFDGLSNYYFDGKVGIGLTNPSTTLHVIGNALIIDASATKGLGVYASTTGIQGQTVSGSGIVGLSPGAGSWSLPKTGILGVKLDDGDYAGYFNGNIYVTESIASGTATITASADNTDVSGINTMFINITSNIVLGGLTGGVDGQMLQIVYKGNYTATCTVEDTEGEGDQDFYTHTRLDESIDGGGYTFVCDGSNWYDTSHARHV